MENGARVLVFSLYKYKNRKCFVWASYGSVLYLHEARYPIPFKKIQEYFSSVFYMVLQKIRVGYFSRKSFIA